MKDKLLFVIDSLTIGGAEKSLISLLSMIDSSLYNIDLLVFKEGGELETYIPDYVEVLPVPEYFKFVVDKRKSIRNGSLSLMLHKIQTSLSLRLNNLKVSPIHSEQVVYKCIQSVISPLSKTYDVAIAYSQGMPTYFVANKVYAAKKLAWINTDYVNTLYDKEIDYDSYKRFDKIIAVSQHTRDSVAKIRYEYKLKVDLLLDIVNPELINGMSEENMWNVFDSSVTNILTVGRLEPVKAYDKAIEVAKRLKESSYKFKWYVIGDGAEKSRLQNLIKEYGLMDNFVLLGKKLNPYVFMKESDIYVQTSLKEGFGLTVIEAKILKIPIVCTNFPTAREIINNNVDGLIVEHDIDSIYNGIKKYLDDKNFRKEVSIKLNKMTPYSSIDQIEKFYKLIHS
ncbi:glycosyltransferase [Oceanobacillus sp. CF4.6]|uniref:glycosyltransferase n=1 Tax=Oceanobacillus sp. CF4.6 TaxID=3373080 RepID=UPI003EE6B0E5